MPTESHMIVVRMGQGDQEKVKSKTSQEILGEIKEPGAVAVKKLESGDLRIFTISRAAKERMSQDPSWIQKTYPSALPSLTQNQVLVHGVQVEGIDPKAPQLTDKEAEGPTGPTSPSSMDPRSSKGEENPQGLDKATEHNGHIDQN